MDRDKLISDAGLVGGDQLTSAQSHGFLSNAAQLTAAAHEIHEMRHSINAAEFVPKTPAANMSAGISMPRTPPPPGPPFKTSSACTSPTPRAYGDYVSNAGHKSKSTEDLVAAVEHHYRQHHSHHPHPHQQQPHAQHPPHGNHPHPASHHPPSFQPYGHHPGPPHPGYLHPSDRYPPPEQHPRFHHPNQGEIL